MWMMNQVGNGVAGINIDCFIKRRFSLDYIMDAKTSVEDALKKAVIRSERMAGEKQIRQMVDLTIDLVLAILKNIVVGEEPVQLSSPSGLTMTIAMYPKGSISNKVIKHGESTYVFPHVCDILIHQECYGNETLGVSFDELDKKN